MVSFNGERFVLLDMKAGVVMQDEFHEPLLFLTKQRAEEKAGSLNAGRGKKDGVVLVHGPILSAALNWADREATKLSDGTYKPLMQTLRRHTKPIHYAHVSKEDPQSIAYTKNEADGIRDIQKRMRIAAYLEKYAPTLNEAHRLQLEQEQMTATACGNVMWARTAAEIERVYTNYSNNHDGVAASCMRYTTDHFRSSAHPVTAYGDSDLCVAYLIDKDKRTIARCVVWEEHKIYSRVYGSSKSCSDLMEQLEKAGFQKSIGYYGGRSERNVGKTSLEGARLKVNMDKRRSNHIIMPYVDECTWGEVDKEKKWVTLRNGSTDGVTRYLSIKETSGSAPFVGIRCPCCGNGQSEDTTMLPVYTREERNQSVLMCPSCVGRHSFMCEGTHERYDRRNVSSVEVKSQRYIQSWAAANLAHCRTCNSYSLDKDDLHTLTYYNDFHTRLDTIQICGECAKNSTYWCEGIESLVERKEVPAATIRDQRKKVGNRLIQRAVSIFSDRLVTDCGGQYADFYRWHKQREQHKFRAMLVLVDRTTGRATYDKRARTTTIYSAPEDLLAAFDLGGAAKYSVAEYSEALEPVLIRVGSQVRVQNALGLGRTADGLVGVVEDLTPPDINSDYNVQVRLQDGRVMFVKEEGTEVVGAKAPPRWKPDTLRELMVGDEVLIVNRYSPRFGQTATVTAIELVSGVNEYRITMSDGAKRRGLARALQPINLDRPTAAQQSA